MGQAVRRIAGQVAAQEAAAPSHLHHPESCGTVQEPPHLVNLHTEKGPEGRMGAGSRVEIAHGAYVVRVAVIAAVRPEKGQLHELGEGDPSVPSYPTRYLLFSRHIAPLIENIRGPKDPLDSRLGGLVCAPSGC